MWALAYYKHEKNRKRPSYSTRGVNENIRISMKTTTSCQYKNPEYKYNQIRSAQMHQLYTQIRKKYLINNQSITDTIIINTTDIDTSSCQSQIWNFK